MIREGKDSFLEGVILNFTLQCNISNGNRQDKAMTLLTCIDSKSNVDGVHYTQIFNSSTEIPWIDFFSW